MSNDSEVLAGVFVGMIFGSIISGLICSTITDTCWQKELISKNKAEWVIDSKTGIRELKLKD